MDKVKKLKKLMLVLTICAILTFSSGNPEGVSDKRKPGFVDKHVSAV